MMPQTASCHCFLFLFLLYSLHLSPLPAYVLKYCTVVYSENVTAVVSVDCEQRQLISVPDDIPREVISLALQKNYIHKINSTGFYNMSNLRELDLSENVIIDVDDGAFVHLVELKVLHMDHNHLTTLRDNMFQGLSNLLMLSLFGNNIQFINRAAFQSLTSLQVLNVCLNSNQMTGIITILQIPRLQVLDITSFELESFQSKYLTLNMTSELRELTVQAPSMKRFSITTSIFPHLETIALYGCTGPNLTGWEWDIPDKYFLRNITKVYIDSYFIYFDSIRKALQSLDSLEYLQLTDMEKWIKIGLLKIACEIPTLKTLNLTFINFITINLSEKLSSCTQLISLDLSYNNLNELSKDSLTEMKQLMHLNLSYNQLSKVPDDVKNLSMLQTLNLRYNHIHDLSCTDFLNLTRLTHLHLDTNVIADLKQCVFQHLFDLKVLTVSHNSIWTFGDTFKTGLQKLEILDLNKNIILALPGKGGFKSLKLLKKLDMELGQTISEWDNIYFEGLDELETLSLIFYTNPFRITSLPHELPLLKSLKNFTIEFIQQTHDLFQNVNIRQLLSDMKHLEHFTAVNVFSESDRPDSGTFEYVPQLKTLTLRSNNLPCLHPGTLNPIQNLEALDLSNNKLKSLDFLAQSNLTRLSWLDVNQNELTVVNVSVFSFLPALRYVYMGDNPFACDCSNSDFQQWILYNKQTQVVGAHSYTCGYPLAKKGTRFLDFDFHSCEQMDTSFICYISTTCVIVLTLLASFTYQFLRLHLLYGYYLFLAFLYDAKERKRGSPQRYDAFISYNVHDELWVCREMLPVLEREQGWRLCLHQRDFLPGKPIIDNITEAIYGSRKTICVISHHYLESEWCSREFQMASYRLLDEKKDVLILVFLEDIPAHQLSPYYHMRRLVKRQSYLSWSQAGQHPGLFWQNLCRALGTPHTHLAFNE